MTVKRLKDWRKDPKPMPIPGNDRCEGKVSETNWGWRRKMHAEGMGRYSEGAVDQCTRDAVVEIDGKKYCRLHGGHVVLDMYMDGKLVHVREGAHKVRVKGERQ